MTVSLFVRSKVKDYATWKASFDAGAEFVKEKGVVASKALRDLDDPNLVIVHHEFADAGKAEAFVALVNSDLFRKGDPVKKGGVILETLEMWVGEDVT
jgi:hypothetical protein